MRNSMKSGVKKRSAFTLIELLVVIAIIGILAAIIIVLLNSARRRAQDAQIKSDITSMSQALEIVKVDRPFVATATWSNITDGAVDPVVPDDSNIDRWREDGATVAPAKRLIAVKPKHPMSLTYMVQITTDSYAILAKLNPTDSYFCNTNGTTKTVTGATVVIAQAACQP